MQLIFCFSQFKLTELRLNHMFRWHNTHEGEHQLKQLNIKLHTNCV